MRTRSGSPGPADPTDLLARRLDRQLLSSADAPTPERVVDRLLAVQAQDPRGFRLCVRARSHNLSAADVDSALSDRRTLVVSWLNRGTLHLVGAAEYWWLHQLTAPRMVRGNERRLRQEGVSAEHADLGVQVVCGELSVHGARTRSELRGALDAAGVPTAGQALVHILALAALREHVIRGPVRGGEHCFVDARSWLGAPSSVPDRDESLAVLAARYLAGHAPAGERDLATWAGISLTDARRGLAAVSAETIRRADGLVEPANTPPPVPPPPPRLLGPYDPVLHGWASRELVVGRHAGIVTSNGLFRPFALVDGRAVAVWSLRDGRIALRPLEPLSARDRVALDDDTADVLRFLNLPRSRMILDDGEDEEVPQHRGRAADRR